MKKSILSAVFAVILVFAVAFLIAPKANAASITLQDGETLNITEDAILDLAGNSGAVHVAEGVKLSVIDSANKSITGANAGKLTVLSGEVEAEAEDATGKRFLKLQNADGTFSFHPFYVTIKQIGINTNKGTLCLQAMFVANEVAQQAISTGIVYGEGELTNAAPTYGTFAFKDGVMYAYYDLMGSFADQTAMEKVKSFRAYITVGKTSVYSKTIATISPLETLNTVSERFATFSDYQQSTMMKMIENNPQLHEVPSIVELNNLLADKQIVQNMNDALAGYAAPDFGMVKERLKDFGYGTDNNFAAKTKGHSIRWFVDDKGTSDESDDISMIVLVNAEGKIVFPEEYKGIDASNIRVFFDLSLPAAVVEIAYNQPVSGWDIGTSGAGREEISALYTFCPAIIDENSDYGHWYADFYISFTKVDGTPLYTKNDVMSYLAAIKLGGFYYGWSLGPFRDNTNTVTEEWLILPVAGDSANPYDPIDVLDRQREVPLVLTILQSGDPEGAASKTSVTYEMMLAMMAEENGPTYFKCGVADADGGADVGVNMYVELRLTNPENEADQKVIGMYEYTFK